jgi:hypothetical protein
MIDAHFFANFSEFRRSKSQDQFVFSLSYHTSGFVYLSIMQLSFNRRLNALSLLPFIFVFLQVSVGLLNFMTNSTTTTTTTTRKHHSHNNNTQ